jgi:hypothetical protein
MSSKRREATEATEPEAPLSKKNMLELNMLDFEQRLKAVEDFSVETREVAALSTQSLPFLMLQFKQVIADGVATKGALLTVQNEAVRRHQSFESSMRTASREGQRAQQLARYIDLALRRYHELSEKVVALEEDAEHYKLRLEAKEKIIEASKGLIAAVDALINAKKEPADILTEVKNLMKEVPKPLPQSSEEEEETTIPPGELDE